MAGNRFGRVNTETINTATHGVEIDAITGNSAVCNIVKRSSIALEVIEGKRKEEVETGNTSFPINQKLYNEIKDQADIKHTTVNALVNNFIDQFFNPETGEFTIEVDAVEKYVPRGLSVKTRKDAIEALRKGAKERNMDVGEYFTKMFNQVKPW